MKYDEYLQTLLPDELKSEVSRIERIIAVLGLEVRTNKRYLLRDKGKSCPRCGSINIYKNGNKNGTQRYHCKDCNKYFAITNNSIFYWSKLSHVQFITFLKCLSKLESLEITAKEVGLTLRQTYNIRIKIISLLKSYKVKELKGVIQADEKYVHDSYKGTRKNKMPRESRKNGNGLFVDFGSGISKRDVCIVGAIDSEDNIILEVVGNGIASTEMIESGLKNKIVKGSVLVTDSKNSYIKFAKDNNLILKQIPSGYHKIEQYHLGELNSLFLEVENLLRNSHGISTRHLQEYLDLLRFKKILHYTVEYLETPQVAFKYLTTSSGDTVKARDVCKKPLPIDTDAIYSDRLR